MKKISYFILIAFVFSIHVNAQRQKITLFLNDGTVVEGYSKPVFYDGASYSGMLAFNKTKVKVWSTYEGKEHKSYTMDEIQKLNVHHRGYVKKFEKIEVSLHGNPFLAEVIQEGKVTLFKKTFSHTAPASMGTYNPVTKTWGINRMGGTYNQTVYYVKRASETVATDIEIGPIFNSKKELINYFNDCPELVKRIEEKEFKMKDIEEIVYFYNDKCGT